jgi:hypothetical protein
MLAVEHKAARKNICAEPHGHSEKDEVFFCQKTDDETWVHHYDPLMKGQSWKCIISRRHAKKNSRCRYMRKVTASVFREI